MRFSRFASKGREQRAEDGRRKTEYRRQRAESSKLIAEGE